MKMLRSVGEPAPAQPVEMVRESDKWMSSLRL